MRASQIFVALSTLLVGGCGYHGASIKGRVFEIANFDGPLATHHLVPLADVDVLVIWSGDDNVVHPHALCLKAVYTKTTPDGRFAVPGWWARPRSGVILNLAGTSYVYKSGYVEEMSLSTVPGLRSTGPGVHLLRKAKASDIQSKREDAFVNSRGCPGENS